MSTAPDFVVMDRRFPDARLVVEVKRQVGDPGWTTAQVAHFMRRLNASLGLVVSPERMWVLRDLYLSDDPGDVRVLGEENLDPSDWPGRDPNQTSAEFEDTVRRWLQDLATTGSSVWGPSPNRHPILLDWVLPMLRHARVQSSRPISRG